MKPNQEQIEDQVVDALLSEQSRSDRQASIDEIENAVDMVPRTASLSSEPSWRRKIATIAASLAFLCAIVFGAKALIELKREAELTAARDAEAQKVRDREEKRIALAKAIRNQEDKVEERRKVLACIARTKGIIYQGNDSFYGINGESAAGEAVNVRAAIQQEKLQLESQIRSLSNYDGDQLMTYASGLEMPDNVTRSLYPQYLETKRQLDKLKADGMGDGHPTVQSATSQVKDLKTDMDEGIVNLRATLQAQLDLASNRLDNIQIALNEERGEAIKCGLDAQDYVDAKRAFETDQEQLMKMKLELAMMGGAPESLPSEPTNAQPHPTQAPVPTTKQKIAASPVLRPESSTSLEPNLSLRARVVPAPRGRVTDPRQPQPNTERYAKLIDPTWKRPESDPLSTFSIDVDNASYSIIRRMIRDGRPVPPDAVRIEECINAFDYNYAPPTGDNAFAFHTTLATCPWNEGHYLAKIGIKGRELDERPASNLVFLIDVSGSMQSRDKLPLVKESLKLLLHQLDGRDSVSFVVYAGREGVALPPTKLTTTGRIEALEALDRLQSGGSTNGGAGIRRAYQLAAENYIDGGANRVLLATDGDFNVGVTNQKELVDLVKERASNHIYLSILGFGAGNLNDSMLEAVSGDGNGNYYYIDSIREGRKVLLEKLSGTLVTIAKDVKIQIEFNPRRVGSYRLIGYANRVLENRDFNDDKVDAGDIGAGHTVTVFYEIVPAGSAQPNHGGVDPLKYQKASEEPAPSSSEGTESEWLTLKLRHKHPEGNKSALQQSVIKGDPLPWLDCGQDFQFASAVALFGMKLRGMQDAEAITWRQIQDLAQPGLENDPKEDRSEFINLLEAMEKRGR